jgi:FtsH-binding integral membrane protein
MVEESPLQPRMGPAVVTYVVTLFAAIYVWATYEPRGVAMVLTIAAPVAAFGWLARQAYRRRRSGSCTNPAQRAYQRRAIPLMIAYVAALFVAIWVHERMAPAGALAVALAVLPALPLIGMIWAMGRLLVEEQDEYLRSLHVRQFMVATGFMLVVTCVWGFLENFELVPHVPMYWAFIIWCAGLGIGTLINELRS